MNESNKEDFQKQYKETRLKIEKDVDEALEEYLNFFGLSEGENPKVKLALRELIVGDKIAYNYKQRDKITDGQFSKIMGRNFEQKFMLVNLVYAQKQDRLNKTLVNLTRWLTGLTVSMVILVIIQIVILIIPK